MDGSAALQALTEVEKEPVDWVDVEQETGSGGI